MVDVQELTKIIVDNPEHIITILEALGYTPRDRGKYIVLPHKNGDNPSAISVLKSTLHYIDHSHGGEGNIFTFTVKDRHCSFPDALEWIANKIGVNPEYKQTEIKYPFNHFYKDMVLNSSTVALTEYKESQLCPADKLVKLWFDSGVSYQTQEKYGVRYDYDLDCVVIPVYDINGRLVGAKKRANGIVDTDKRWGMYIPYPKTQVVYGLNFNYQTIVEKSALIIFEAEKSVHLADEYGVKCTCAIGGHNISNVQSKIIQSLFCDKIIVAFDEGICQEECEYETKKLITNNPLIKNKVGYIYDNDNKYLVKGSKDSPADLGQDKFNMILKEKVVWLKEK